MQRYNPMTKCLETVKTNDRKTVDKGQVILKDKNSKVVLGKVLTNHSMSIDDLIRHLNLKVDEDVVFTEIENEKINQCILTVEMDSLPLKKTYKLIKSL